MMFGNGKIYILYFTFLTLLLSRVAVFENFTTGNTRTLSGTSACLLDFLLHLLLKKFSLFTQDLR